ncbi:bll1586 [Bradyrhizobium diazoefficiens USDA 110]|uniref:Bll1586 protein n=2 Tax=Bradyrhizobium TaxID=374 RepID=Q89U33_BRADU|nr:excisionase [Bradyrhizobium japonicum]AND87228.1 excisionase [Bradyrhizobium diazoefficiens USDA 110]APO50211.1 excisionase [Bradyrhizobium diazoefficiens]BAL13507.1 excisionase [Bradyrhizobium japonicum USDA 6]KGT76950.1 excisionase [Bradyrhizobium japonicum]
MIEITKRPKGVGLHDPLRLAVAAAVAFPDGSMTASGLRRESARGRLIIERIAGKDYTTLFYIERMRELCRVEARVPGSISRPLDETKPARLPTGQRGSSETTAWISAQAARQMKLRPPSKR